MAVKVQGETSQADIQRHIGGEFRLHDSLSRVGCPNILTVHAVSYRRRPTPPTDLGYLYLEWASGLSLQHLVSDNVAANARLVTRAACIRRVLTKSV
jgi:hypothetical protein